jgi:two-component system cell cycle sensor histidine kinase/response regulator CckA
VVVAVEDTGTGMDTETRARIFEPFFTTKPAGEGTGLGLSTAYGIVADCGGRIDVESEPGRGSTFRIHLPIVAEAGLETTDVALPPTAPRGDERVLVCEDDVGVRNFTCRALRAAGYDVLEASDGEQALGRARENSQPIDLLLTDVVMPGIGGCELATRLGEEQPDLRLLFVSGYAAGLFDPDELRAIGDDFLEKPYDTGTLLRQVRSTLDTPHEAGRAAR